MSVLTGTAYGFEVVSGISSYQVFQRNHETNLVDIPLVIKSDKEGTLKLVVHRADSGMGPIMEKEVGSLQVGDNSMVLKDLPMGGPYNLKMALVEKENKESATAEFINILVGDLWILAGQSNMQGVGDLVDVEAPSNRVNIFRMRHEWDNAIEPIHRLNESVDPVHRGDAKMPTREEADRTASLITKGAGLGLTFAKQMVGRNGVPIGLVPVAHGGTSMDQWNPDLKDKGGDSLYGSFYKTLQAVGGKVTGILWYQGESDAMGGMEITKAYPDKFTRLIDSMRADCGDPNLPFYYVQIGRFTNGVSGEFITCWNMIQESQRTLVNRVPNTGVVPSVDLMLDDPIHIGTPGLKTLGKRLCQLAISKRTSGPDLDVVEKIPGGKYRLTYKNVNTRLYPEGEIHGFSFRTPDGTDLFLIYKAIVDPQNPNSVLLFVREDIPVPADAVLWYGYGLMPVCNLTDQDNMGALVTGPVELPD